MQFAYFFMICIAVYATIFLFLWFTRKETKLNEDIAIVILYTDKNEKHAKYIEEDFKKEYPTLLRRMEFYKKKNKSE